MSAKSIAIIGAGFAGISAGIYGQMNGYNTQIFELHNLPGGLCASWKRKGYTIDGCIHWLVGSSPANSLFTFWQEVGLLQDRQFVDLDIFTVIEDEQGRAFNMYVNPDRLEKHMLDLAPQDAGAIRELTDGIRLCKKLGQPAFKSGLAGLLQKAGFFAGMLSVMPQMRKWMNLTLGDLADRFQDPFLRKCLKDALFPDMAALGLVMTLAFLDSKTAGYPLGGSMPLAQAIEKRYLDLGGTIHYSFPVEKILVEDNRAVGVRLKDGSEHRADMVISAADGHATIFKMLEGRYLNDTIRGYYDNMPIFPGLVFVGLGINRSFADETQSVSGVKYSLKTPIVIGGKSHEILSAHLYNFDPTLAPDGKSVLTIMFDSDYDYWKSLAADPAAYQAEKHAVSEAVLDGLEQRWPGIASQVEMIDVATPLTFERYTGNWQGSFEGWMITPKVLMMKMDNTLPGLENFYMAGQWVQPGGGLPGGVMSGRRAITDICKKDKVKFHTTKI